MLELVLYRVEYRVAFQYLEHNQCASLLLHDVEAAIHLPRIGLASARPNPAWSNPRLIDPRKGPTRPSSTPNRHQHAIEVTLEGRFQRSKMY
jgi:hypothetical protein